MQRAVAVRPTTSQLAWQRQEITAFIHFGMNTFQDTEVGKGTESPEDFNPRGLDCRQWATACKKFGAGTIIFVAKHHDGFCLWPSAFTAHSVGQSPWRDGAGDVVREMATACEELQLGLGLYLSPTDLNHPAYAHNDAAYNEYFKSQLRELLTNYGPIREIWFDGSEPPGRRQRYDWTGFYSVIREIQPDCLISIRGPDIRWVGNERGTAREAEWSVVPLPRLAREFDWPNMMAVSLGQRDQLSQAVDLHWYPAVAAVPIRPSWFYHQREDSRVRSLARLIDLYFATVGRNCMLLLNLSPDRNGLIPEGDIARLREWTHWRQATFGTNLSVEVQAARGEQPGIDGHEWEKILDGDLDTWWQPKDWCDHVQLTIDLARPTRFDVVQLREAIQVGQRIERFSLDAWTRGVWTEIARGRTVGYQRLLPLEQPVETERVRIRFEQFRVAPTLSEIGLFLQAAVPKS